MAPSSLLSILLPLILLFALANATVDQTCKAAAASNWTVNYQFCTTSLQADPKSASADARGLALIAAQLSLANATSTRSKIDSLSKKNLDPTVKAVLGMCSNLYSDLIPNLASTVDAIRSGSYKDAATKLDKIKDYPFDCEDLFFEGGEQSPVAKEDNDLAGLAALALAITISLG